MDIHTLEISRIQFAKYAFTLYSIWEIVDAYHRVSQYQILQNNCGHSGHLLFNVSLHSKKWGVKGDKICSGRSSRNSCLQPQSRAFGEQV